MNITEVVLSIEAYVEVDPAVKDTFKYKIAYLFKEEIRKHKWNEGTRGRTLSWIEARDEWLKLYRDSFIKHVKSVLPPVKKPKSIVIDRRYTKRDSVITGGLV